MTSNQAEIAAKFNAAITGLTNAKAAVDALAPEIASLAVPRAKALCVSVSAAAEVQLEAVNDYMSTASEFASV